MTDIEGIYRDIPDTSLYMDRLSTELSFTTLIFTNVGGFRENCKVVGIVLYVVDQFMPVTFSIWRPTTNATEYLLVDFFSNDTTISQGYQYINVSQYRGDMRGNEGDFFGVSLGFLPGTPVTERSCSIKDIDGAGSAYSGYTFQDSLFIDSLSTLTIYTGFNRSANCLDYFIEAVVQYDNGRW